jgi:hypothetical protein
MIGGVANLAVRIAAALLCVPPESIVPPIMLAPLPMSPTEMRHREVIDETLLAAWNKGDGFVAPAEEEEFVDSIGRSVKDGLMLQDQSAADILGILGVAGVINEDEYSALGKADTYISARPSTYGEITSLGARQLFHGMGMKATLRDFETQSSNDIVFYDLGSGAGRLTVQSYLELSRLVKAVGVELAPTRHSAAVQAWERLVASGEAKRVRRMGLRKNENKDDKGCAQLEIHQGDLFSLNISDATHIYASSLCFTDGMMAKLAAKLSSEAPKLQSVASLKHFPPGTLFGIGTPYSELVEMSWTKTQGQGCSVYFYKRKV